MIDKPKIGIAVDCSVVNGNPGNAEFRGIDLCTGEIYFDVKISGACTNNIAEFAALVEGVKWLILTQNNGKVYSDSKIALNWYRNKRTNSHLPRENKTTDAYFWLDRSVRHIPLRNHMKYVEFWNKYKYGSDVPADYGRKGKQNY